jgi:hypothetical protein
VLFDPSSHERLTETTWSESTARAAIGAIVADAESAFDEASLWPAHPLDEDFGDELWLERARTFAMHSIEQVEYMRATHGRGRYTLWTGDVGTALYVWSCVTGTAAMPTLDRW